MAVLIRTVLKMRADEESRTRRTSGETDARFEGRGRRPVGPRRQPNHRKPQEGRKRPASGAWKVHAGREVELCLRTSNRQGKRATWKTVACRRLGMSPASCVNASKKERRWLSMDWVRSAHKVSEATGSWGVPRLPFSLLTFRKTRGLLNGFATRSKPKVSTPGSTGASCCRGKTGRDPSKTPSKPPILSWLASRSIRR